MSIFNLYPKYLNLTYLTCIDIFNVILKKFDRLNMVTVTVSPKYQVVIPRAIRDQLNIKVGQKLQLISYQNRIEFIPLRNIKDMKGFLKGIDTTIKREKDRI